MPKFLLLFIIGLFLMNKAEPQSRDTIVTYYTHFFNRTVKVSTLDSADMIKVVYPADSEKNIHDFKEFYKNGQVKTIGKIDMRSTAVNIGMLSDNCITYYPNGKRQDIAHYTNGKKDGFEYIFRTDGHIQQVIKWIKQPIGFINKKLYWECYDSNDNMICENGNGKWLIYDPDFKNILLSGQIKNGYMDGDWHGFTLRADSIKYTCTYKKGVFVSANGYDKDGKAYPFVRDREPASYNGGTLLGFIGDLNKYLKIPKDANGRKINIDTIHITFTLESDGRLVNLELLGMVNPELKDAINVAISKCDNLVACKYFGIPFSAKIVLSLDVKISYSNYAYQRSIQKKETALDFLKPPYDFRTSN